jgi:hypothetical protein
MYAASGIRLELERRMTPSRSIAQPVADPATTALYVKLAAGEVRTAEEKAIGRRPGRSKPSVAK